MKSMIFNNAIILEGEEFEITRGYLVVEDGVITEIGEGKTPKKRAIDVKRGYVVPSFTNAHVHLGDGIAQDIGAYEPIEKRVGKESIKFKILKRNIIPGIKASLKEMISSGTTSFCDFREGGVEGIKKLKGCLTPLHEAVILGRPDGDPIQSVLNESNGIGISSISSYNETELKKISTAVKSSGKLLAIHAGEVRDDLEEALKLEPDFLVHLTNVNEESLELVFSKNLPVVLCPRANAMLGVGIPPIKEILSNTLAAFGTDNVMVNSLNMLREMEFAFKIIRGLSKDYRFNGERILKAATLNGRRVLGLEDNAIKEGAKADFLIFHNRKYIYDPIIAILHRFEIKDIRALVKGSKCIKRY
jgi:cytosine/adenosine deaminase-related metal-dependent hydrolase